MSALALTMNRTSPFFLFDGTESGASSLATQVPNCVKAIISHFQGSAFGNQRIDQPAQTILDIYASCNKKDWNGDGAEPISKESAEEAINLLLALPLNLPIPDIFADPTGAIAFEWYRKPSHRLALIIYGNRTVEFTGLYGIGDGVYGEARIRNGFPKIIRSHLRELFSD